MSVIPEFIFRQQGITRRQWKSMKRQEIREVKRSLEKFRVGCAYTPALGVEAISDWIDRTIRYLSQDNWGR